MAELLQHSPHRAREAMLSTLVMRNLVVAGRRTSVRLEPVMWEALREIARGRAISVNTLATEIDEGRSASSLTAAIRVYIVDFYRAAASGAVPPVWTTLAARAQRV